VRSIANADVELRHANVHGIYSGYGASSGRPGGSVTPTNRKRFLRGHQRANSAGLAVFDTIYPGWYSGRAPHIHLKVHVGGGVVHTGQLFFDDVLSHAVYRSAHYVAHGQPTPPTRPTRFTVRPVVRAPSSRSRARPAVTSARSGWRSVAEQSAATTKRLALRH
jgi:hypothetical protein